MFGVEAHMASRTRSSSFGLLSRLGVRPRVCLAMFFLVGGLSSPAPPGGLPLWFSCFAGTTPPFDSPPPCMWALWLIAFSHRSAAFRPRTVTGPLGSRAWSFYACVGSSTPQGHDALALPHIALWRSRLTRHRPLPDLEISELHVPPAYTPVNASSATSRLPSFLNPIGVCENHRRTWARMPASAQ